MNYIDKATTLGKEHGTNAAEFELQYILGGRVPAVEANANAKAIMRMYNNDGYLESAPKCDLSGQYADGMTPNRLMEMVTGFGGHTECTEDVLDAYENSYNDAAQATIVEAAIKHHNEVLKNERENTPH